MIGILSILLQKEKITAPELAEKYEVSRRTINRDIEALCKAGIPIEGYFDYVVPPLEEFWWQDEIYGVDYAHKEIFQWISLTRLPEFATKEIYQWAVKEATEKKQTDFSKVEFLTYEEGLCVQCMHIGPYDDEPETV